MTEAEARYVVGLLKSVCNSTEVGTNNKWPIASQSLPHEIRKEITTKQNKT